MDTQVQVREIEELVANGRKDDAVRALSALSSVDIHDADFHRRLADLAEAAGHGPLLAYELNLAFRDDPSDVELLRRLAQVHNDAGRPERAVKCWRAVTERVPSDADAWEELGLLLTELGRDEDARDVFENALRATNDRRFKARVREAARSASATEDSADLPSDAVVARFVSIFGGREGVYARQYAGANGESGYTPVREPFTHDVAQRHLLGSHTVGIYPLRADNTVNFAAIDLDLTKPVVDRAGPDSPVWRTARVRMLEYAGSIADAGAECGVHVYLEDSGFKGIHCWVFFATPLPGRFARLLTDALLERAGSPPHDVSVERFPKQAAIRLDALGNLIKLPMGIHRRSGRRSAWLDPQGVRIEDGAAHLLAIRRTEHDAVHAMLDTRFPRVHDDDGQDDGDGPPFDEARATAHTVEYRPETDFDLQTVLTRCATLRELVRKSEIDRHLSHEEALVLVHTVGHIPSGPQAVNAVLGRCPGVDPSMRMKSRLRGNPMSCPKIRAKIPHVTSLVPCDCQFDPGAGLYPTPILHIEHHDGPGPPDVQALRLEGIVQDFLRAHKSLHDAQHLYDTSAARLGEMLDAAGVDHFDTPLGKVRRIRDEAGAPNFQLEV